MKKKIKFSGIQMLRAFAAFSISVSHIPFTSKNNWNIVFGVDIFLVITGFLAVYTTQECKNFSVKNFWIKKAIRLLPLYWIITIGTYCAALIMPSLTGETPSVTELIKSLLLIPYTKTSTITASTVIRPIVGPAHTLMYDVYFYIIFAFFAKISYKNRALYTAIFLIVVCCLGHVVDTNNVYLSFYSSMWVIDLVFGMVLFYVYKRIKQEFKSLLAHHLIWFWTFCISLVMMVYVSRISVSGLNYIFFKCMPAFLMVLSVLMLEEKAKCEFIKRLGDISYSYYLIHYYFLVVIEHFIINLDTFSVKGLICSLIGFIFAEFIAYFSWKFIEVKLGDYLKRRFLIEGKK